MAFNHEGDENMENSNYIVITGVLIVVSLFLKNWQPPMKRQYIAMILLTLGVIFGHLLVNNPAYGFLISGLVFYKDELVQEIKKVMESFTSIKKESLMNGEEK